MRSRLRIEDFALILLFMVVSLLMMFASMHYLEHEKKNHFQKIASEISHSQQLVDMALQDDWRHILTDLSLLAKENLMKNYLEQVSNKETDERREQEMRTEIQAIFMDLISAKEIYHKARLIDVWGHEVVHVRKKEGRFIFGVDETSGGPRAGQQQQLQEKRDSDYFIHSMRLNEGEFYVSPFNLNKEFNQVEEPHLPTIRFATPIFSKNKHRLGVLVLSYQGQYLLNILKRLDQHQEWPVELLNENGYWFHNKDNAYLFDFEFGGEYSFQQAHPQAWRVIRFGSSDAFEMDGVHYFFREFRPFHPGNAILPALALPADDKSSVGIALEAYHWKIVTRVHQSELDKAFAPHSNMLMLVTAMMEGVLLLLLLTGLWWNRRKRRTVQENLDDIAAQTQFHKLQGIIHQELNLEPKLEQFLEILFSIPWLSRFQGGEIILSTTDTPSVLVRSRAFAKANPSCRMSQAGMCPHSLLAGESMQVCDQFSDTDLMRVCLHTRINPRSEAVLAVYLRRDDSFGQHLTQTKTARAQGNKTLSFLNNAVQLLHDLIKHEDNIEELRKFQRTVEQSPVSVVITDTKGCIEYVNLKFTQVSGFSLEEALGNNSRVLNSGVQPKAFYQEMWKTISSGQEWQGEFCNRRKDGSLYWESAVISPIRNSANEITHYIAINEDITARKQEAEERSILERQLRQAQKMESLGHLTGGIAHDFNNILAAIKGFSELAIVRFGQDEKSKLHHYLRNILTAADRARDLIAQMMLFSRSKEAERREVMLTPLVKEVIKLMRATLPASISITQSFTEQDLIIQSDPVQLHQILMNLMVNARDAMDGKGQLAVRLGVEQEGAMMTCTSCHNMFYSKELIFVSIRDSGTGIPEEIIEKIFEPFFTTKEVGKGTGMGLSVVHGILHAQQAHVVVRSEAGKGTEFRLYFHPCNTLTMAKKSPLAETLQQELLTGVVLVVDDEAGIVEFLKEMLESRGLSVITKTSSVEALTLFEQLPHRFDLVISDQTMPELTGLEMIHEMRELRRDLPVILCTGYSKDIDASNAASHGIAHFLKKPIDTELLNQALTTVFATRLPG